MFKQLILIFSLVSFLAVFAVAQENLKPKRKKNKNVQKILNAAV